MSGNNDSFEKVFDALLDQAAAEADARLGAQAETIDEDVVFSKQHEKQMKKLFRQERRREAPKWAVYSRRAACVLLVCFLASGTVLFSVDAWRVNFLNFFFEAGKPNTDYHFGDEGGISYADDDITLGYVPNGFVLTKKESSNHSLFLMFEREEQYFQFSVDDITIRANIDTENAIVTPIQINGVEGMLISNNNINAVVWHDDTLVYEFVGNISTEELLKIAKKVEK